MNKKNSTDIASVEFYFLFLYKLIFPYPIRLACRS